VSGHGIGAEAPESGGRTTIGFRSVSVPGIVSIIVAPVDARTSMSAAHAFVLSCVNECRTGAALAGTRAGLRHRRRARNGVGATHAGRQGKVSACAR
jgi:hypothetical protein